MLQTLYQISFRSGAVVTHSLALARALAQFELFADGGQHSGDLPQTHSKGLLFPDLRLGVVVQQEDCSRGKHAGWEGLRNSHQRLGWDAGESTQDDKAKVPGFWMAVVRFNKPTLPLAKDVS